MRKTLFSLTLLALSSFPAVAQEAKGTWLTGKSDSHVVVEPCGSNLCGRVAWLSEPNDPATGKAKLDDKNADEAKRSRKILGINILIGMKDQGDGLYKGSVYNPRDGKTYSGSIKAAGNTMTMKGCVLGGLICQSETWTRVK